MAQTDPATTAQLLSMVSLEAIGAGGSVKFLLDKYLRPHNPAGWVILVTAALLSLAAGLMHRLWQGDRLDWSSAGPALSFAGQTFVAAVVLTDEHNRARERGALRAALAEPATSSQREPAAVSARPAAASPMPAPPGAIELPPGALAARPVWQIGASAPIQRPSWPTATPPAPASPPAEPSPSAPAEPAATTAATGSSHRGWP